MSQLFTVPHDRKRKREEAAAAQQQQDGGAPGGSPVAGKPELPGPNPEFPILHYVLSYKVSRFAAGRSRGPA